MEPSSGSTVPPVLGSTNVPSDLVISPVTDRESRQWCPTGCCRSCRNRRSWLNYLNWCRRSRPSLNRRYRKLACPLASSPRDCRFVGPDGTVGVGRCWDHGDGLGLQVGHGEILQAHASPAKAAVSAMPWDMLSDFSADFASWYSCAVSVNRFLLSASLISCLMRYC